MKRDGGSAVMCVSAGRVVSAREPGMGGVDPLLALLREWHRRSGER